MSERTNWAEVNPPIIATFRANHGQVGGRFAASPVLLLHTVGARTGQARINPLTYLPDGDRFVVFATDQGAPGTRTGSTTSSPARPCRWRSATRSSPPPPRVAEEPERSELFARQVAALPRFGEYQEKTSRTIPVVILTPSGPGAGDRATGS